MTGKIKTKIKRLSVVCAISIMVVLMSVLIGRTYSDELNNDVRLEENSELRYYLKVKYDGADKNGKLSSDTKTANIRSSIIHVEDKLPDGLEFVDFEKTITGSIGAVQRGNSSVPCTGKVIDDTGTFGDWNEDHTEYTYFGLHYNETTRTVSFNVENLQAGCVLSVGIITKTPTLASGEKRKDFYNFATIVENEISAKSNTVHTYIGNLGEDESLYNVTYKYDGTQPANAPEPPEKMQYVNGATVGVSGPINVEGYEFTGWRLETGNDDVEINGDKFVMPEHDVELVGGFNKIEIPEYTVKYQINGVTPKGYILPYTKSYAEGKQVIVDSLKPGDIFNGYQFLGWKTTEADVEDGKFIMPGHDVTIVGSFQEIRYRVIYKFYDGVKPENAQQYLPATKTYKPGEKVSLENVKGEPEGYKFLGWYKEDNFEMPNEDVVIYGEWKVQNGTFAPEITKEIINNNNKAIYKAGDKVEFKITVTNTASFDITKVMIKENNDNANFIEGEGYEVSSDHMVIIPVLTAGESMDIYSEYIVTKKDVGTITNEVEIKGALADNNNVLENKDYKASTTFEVEKQAEVKPGVENPITLDNIIKYVIIAVISLASIIGIFLIIKKMNKNKA